MHFEMLVYLSAAPTINAIGIANRARSGVQVLTR